MADDKLYDFIKGLFNNTFLVVIALVDLLFKLLIFIGALVSIVLLFKLFPDIAKTIYEGIFPMFQIIGYLLIAFLVILFFLAIMFLCSWTQKLFKDVEEKHKLKGKKFMDELVIKLKKELKKK